MSTDSATADKPASDIDADDVRPRVFASVAVVEYPGSIEAEAIRGLRTRIMAQHAREGRRALAVCAATQGAGCTFVAANLAVALGQIGVKTVIVDADLRFPEIAPLLKLDTDVPGLADYLADDALDFDTVLQGPIYPSVWAVSAGRVRPNPQELLSGDRFRGFVDTLLREFELTIFDTTAANRCTDAQRVATVAAYSLIVARKHQSYVSDISTLAKLLRADRSTVIGTVLNEF
jgi:capsular exopolysaccharide synthesis family protein